MASQGLLSHRSTRWRFLPGIVEGQGLDVIPEPGQLVGTVRKGEEAAAVVDAGAVPGKKDQQEQTITTEDIQSIGAISRIDLLVAWENWCLEMHRQEALEGQAERDAEAQAARDHRDAFAALLDSFVEEGVLSHRTSSWSRDLLPLLEREGGGGNGGGSGVGRVGGIACLEAATRAFICTALAQTASSLPANTASNSPRIPPSFSSPVDLFLDRLAALQAGFSRERQRLIDALYAGSKKGPLQVSIRSDHASNH